MAKVSYTLRTYVQRQMFRGKRPGLPIPDLGPLSPRQGRDRCHYDLKRLVSAPLPPDYSDIIDEWTLAVSNLK